MRGTSLFCAAFLACALLAVSAAAQKAHAYKWIGMSISEPPKQQAVPAPVKKKAANEIAAVKKEPGELPATTPTEAKQAAAKAAKNAAAPLMPAIAETKKNLPEMPKQKEITVQLPRAYVDETGDLKKCADRKKFVQWLEKQPVSTRRKLMSDMVSVTIPIGPEIQ